MELNLIVIGQGYVGLPLSVTAAKAGFMVYGFDTNSKRIGELKIGESGSSDLKKVDLLNLQQEKKIVFTDSMPKVLGPTIYVIAVPTPLTKDKKPDLSMIERACESISSVVSEGALIINESTSYIGTLRDLIKPLIENKSGLTNLFFAVAPERIDPGNESWTMSNTPRVMSGIDNISTARAFDFYSKICDKVIVVSSPEVAEAAKLLENTYRQVNIALVNEFSNITNSFGFSAHEVITAASTKPYGFTAFYPSVGVGGHCIPIDPYYLVLSAENKGVSSNLVNLANDINTNGPANIYKRINLKFENNLVGKTIQIAGISYKPNISDLRESPAIHLMQILKSHGVIVSWHDPHVKTFLGENSSELDSNIDLGLIITPHDNIDFSNWSRSNTSVWDLSSSPRNFGWPKIL